MQIAVDAGPSDGPEGTLVFTGKLLILLSGVLSALCLTAINSVLPSIQKELAHGPNDAMLVKQLLGAVALAMAAGAPLGGFMADRIGLRRTLFIAALVYTVAGTAGLYLSSLPLLLVSRLFLGLAAAAIQVLGLTMVNTQLSGNARARWMGLHVSFAIFTPCLSIRWPGNSARSAGGCLLRSTGLARRCSSACSSDAGKQRLNLPRSRQQRPPAPAS